ncbi:MAG: DUF3124 domain-containing protein [Desulfatirhabdiaceae bacterium]
MIQKWRFAGIWMLLFMGLIPCTGHSAGETKIEIPLSKGQTVYVPVYSHIYIGDKERPFYLTATLSFRNTDPRYAITLLTADYHDSEGKLINRYVEKPIQITPRASTRFVVKESDTAGGSGAHFMVRWRSDQSVNLPIVESVMIGTQTQQGISFTSRGQAVQDH